MGRQDHRYLLLTAGLAGDHPCSGRHRQGHLQERQARRRYPRSEVRRRRAAGVKFAKQQIEDGLLKGKITVAGSTAFESGGAQVTLNASSTLAIDGAQISGNAAGTFGIGPKATLVEGAFEVGMADGGFDGAVTLSKANVAFLQANNVSAVVKGIGKDKPSIKVAGDLSVSLGDVAGDLPSMSYDGGTPTGRDAASTSARSRR